MYFIPKRIFDFLAALCAIVILLPLFVFISIWISIDSKGGVFYKQIRVGKNQKHFNLYKFRSMAVGSDKSGQLTIGQDSRVTKSGKFIRKYKIDEFPQLINILKGEMSVVGPRPEVPKYVELYSDEQLNVLNILPGLTDYASIEYFDEQMILGQSDNPEKTYVEEIMPAKLSLNLKYVANQSFSVDLGCIFKTILKVIK